MTTKKYADYIYKQSKAVYNIRLESIFDEYIVYRNTKRIGFLVESKLYLIATENLRKLLPNIKIEQRYELQGIILIEDIDNIDLLNRYILTVYNDLYFLKDYVFDLSKLLKHYHNYPESTKNIYNAHIVFFRFCYEKGLFKLNPLDEQNRIIYMNYTNNDLTEKGTKVFYDLHTKWLNYTDKIDEKREERCNNVKMLEKYYIKILQELKITE